jgi:hypothetical protein
LYLVNKQVVKRIKVTAPTHQPGNQKDGHVQNNKGHYEQNGGMFFCNDGGKCTNRTCQNKKIGKRKDILACQPNTTYTDWLSGNEMSQRYRNKTRQQE